MSSGDFLEKILERKRAEVESRRAELSDALLEAKIDALTPRRSLFGALSAHGGPVRVIAEVKRASPSVGQIAQLEPALLAAEYERGGAAAISCLTDGPGFGGSLVDLRQVRGACALPVLRKDFILDRYQLLEARVAGADAILLIVAALAQERLKALLSQAGALGLEALVEVHDRPELDRALEAGARVVGINNRNLRTFEVDLSTSEHLVPKVPASVRAVAESGVKTLNDAQRLRAVGTANFLIGEALVRAGDRGELLRQLGALP